MAISRVRGRSSTYSLLRAGIYLYQLIAPAARRRGPASIRHLKQSQIERDRHQERAARLKSRLAEAGLPLLPSPSHIVPVMVGDAELCKAA